MGAGGMSREHVVTTRCDLCGYGGPWSNPEDFRSFGTVDLCRWCCAPACRPGGTIECGRHLVTFGEETWSCSCGEQYRWPRFLPGRVLNAVPSIVTATAESHAQGRTL